MQAALSDYQQVIAGSSGNGTGVAGAVDAEELLSTITRMGRAEGGTYFMMLADSSDRIFKIGEAVSDKLPLTKEGDRVHVIFADSNQDAVFVSEFDNLEITLRSER